MEGKTNGDVKDAGSFASPSPGQMPGRQFPQLSHSVSPHSVSSHSPAISLYSRELKVVPGGVSGMTIETAGTELSGQIMHNRTASGHIAAATLTSPLSSGFPSVGPSALSSNASAASVGPGSPGSQPGTKLRGKPAELKLPGELGLAAGAPSTSPLGRPGGKGAPPPPATFHKVLRDCSAAGDPARQLSAARALRQMARDHEASRPAMVEAGAVTALLSLLKPSDASPRQPQQQEGSSGGSSGGLNREDGSAGAAGSGSGDVSRAAVVEEAVTALLNLSIHPRSRRLMPLLGVFPHLVHVAGSAGSMGARETAAATLFSLSSEDENKIMMIDDGAVRPLLQLLNEPACSEQGRRDACKALFNLSMLSSKRLELVQAGVVPCLLGLLTESTSSLAEKAAAVLSNLTSEAAGRAAIMGDGDDGDSDADGLGSLVEVLETGTPRGREFAVAALWQIASNSAEHRRMILGEALLPSLNGLLQTGTPRAKEKAKLLLANLRGA